MPTLRQKYAKYPRVREWWWRQNKEPLRCSECEAEIPPFTGHLITETQTSPFRGEDEVAITCRECAKRRNQ